MQFVLIMIIDVIFSDFLISSDAEPCYIGQVIYPANAENVTWGVAFIKSICECTEIRNGGGVSVMEPNEAMNRFWFHDEIFSFTDPEREQIWRQDCRSRNDPSTPNPAVQEGEMKPGDVKTTPASDVNGGSEKGGEPVDTATTQSSQNVDGGSGVVNEATTISTTLANYSFSDEIATCESSWDLFGYYCYQANVSAVTFNEAEASCIHAGGHLTSILSEEENAFIDANYTGDHWIGFTNQETRETFSWTDLSQVNYTHWSSGEPNRNKPGEDCAIVNPPNWFDGACTDKKGYICKKEATWNQTSTTFL
ncbi:uncharacterized protein [Amphiura filiformis]|uniref:uncharacterized protein n=1 Tax=Amphiura filiformis TaxID=82378 RepID=UPI003B20D704